MLHQGFVAKYERGKLTSPRHGLATNARILVEGAARVYRVTDPDEDTFRVVTEPDAEGFRGVEESVRERSTIRPGGRRCLAGLIEDREVLENWAERRARHAPDNSETRAKPKLAIVLVSGGGIRSAIWTAKVLEELETRIPEIPYHIRLVTGASGGMLGAGSYVASLLPPSKDGARHSPDLDDIRVHLGRDFLTPMANQLVFSDLPLMFYPATQHFDRGIKLEQAWTRSLSEGGRAGG